VHKTQVHGRGLVGALRFTIVIWALGRSSAIGLCIRGPAVLTPCAIAHLIARLGRGPAGVDTPCLEETVEFVYGDVTRRSDEGPGAGPHYCSTADVTPHTDTRPRRPTLLELKLNFMGSWHRTTCPLM
jgi:hypothetical protein